jgi:LmbE family N-acetylglucosaminyl deacetylase
VTTVLVVAAHPDDEVLGCGGTMAWHAAQGDDVHVALLADGVGSRHAGGVRTLDDTGELLRRRGAANRAAEILGVKSVTFGEFPDNRMDSVDTLDVAQAVEALVARLRPSTIFTHHAGDVNVDHRRIHEAVVTACRPQPGHAVRSILTFEVASSTEWQFPGSGPAFQPNWFVDISAHLEQRQAALAAYAEEMRPFPHARSLDALMHHARWRGASVGVPAAEAFMLGRQLVGR